MINAIAIDDEPPALHVIETFCNKVDFINLQKNFTKPTEALKHLRKFPADLIFVDIKMPAMSGINLVKELQQNTMVIFTTAFSDYAVESYDLNAIDYLLKPINFNRFHKAIHKAKEFHNYINKKEQTGEASIFIRSDFSLMKIPIVDILYIEGLADYLKIFIKDRKTIVARMPMKDMLDKLPTPDFIRVHRSYIIPFNRIHSVRNNNIEIPEREIPIGKTYVEEFFNRYNSK
jgi:DNA-binding LytR/AlgR family response regulator